MHLSDRDQIQLTTDTQPVTVENLEPRILLAANPVISEFMASNYSTIVDTLGQESDWIEIENRGDATANLDGWFLTDTDNNLTKWVFPAGTILTPGETLLVFASEDHDQDTGSELHTNFKLKAEGEYLALVMPDGVTVIQEFVSNNDEYPPQTRDVSYGLDLAGQEVYFADATPDSGNTGGVTDLGPIIRGVNHTPNTPSETQDIFVTARIIETFDPVDNVTLTYRVMFDSETTVSMYDDGMHNDELAGDGIYGGIIPGNIANPGEMVRYYITAMDDQTVTMRAPLFHDATESEQYFGTVIADPAIDSQLPILHWFVQDTAAVDTQNPSLPHSGGTRGSLYYLGEFYDNIWMRARGAGISNIPKPAHKFDFYPGHHFYYQSDMPRVEEFNLNSTQTDISYVRQLLSWDIARDAGLQAPNAFPMRVEQNGQFYSVDIFIEQPDDEFLERYGYDPNGALYKFTRNNNTLGSASDADPSRSYKRSREWEDNSDLAELISKINTGGTTEINWIFDNIDVEQMINFMAVGNLTGDFDWGNKNYYLYRDSDGDGLWRAFAWDKDLTFGRHWRDSGYGSGLFNDIIVIDQDPRNNQWNKLWGSMFQPGVLRDMYNRRLVTLMEEYLNEPGTPDAESYLHQRIDYYYNIMKDDVALDYDKWGPWYWDDVQTFEGGLDIIREQWIDGRREFLFVSSQSGGGTVRPNDPSLGAIWQRIPGPQSANLSVNFGTIEHDPTSGNQDQEYIQITNPNSEAIDISNWTIDGGIQFTFAAGTVIPSGASVYVSPNPTEFKNRTSGPRGGQGLHVVGGYQGRLSSSAETLTIYDEFGTQINSISYPVETTETKFVTEGDDIRWLVPTGPDATRDTTWFNLGFDDSTWNTGQTGIGYERSSANTYDHLIQTDVESEMYEKNETAYIRIDFNVADPSTLESLTLKMKYDDGFIAYLNGVEIAKRNADNTVAWNVGASDGHSDSAAVNYELIDVTDYLDELLAGDNVLAIHAMNSGTTSSDLIFVPELVSITTVFIGEGSPLKNQLRVTELMYNPVSGDSFLEFIEVMNIGDSTLDISGVNFAGGVEYTFPAATSLLEGERVIVVPFDPAAPNAAEMQRFIDFLDTHDLAFDEVRMFGPYQGQLGNGGDEIIVADSQGSRIVRFTYDDGGDWPGRADGNGSSLELIDVQGDYTDPTNWRSSNDYNGSPGAAGSDDIMLSIVINEVLTHTDLPDVDAIELYNPTDSTIDISGWLISDSDTDIMKFVIPSSTILQPGEYVVFDESHFNPTPLTPDANHFALNGAHGDDVWLVSTDGEGNPDQFIDHVNFGAAENGVSFGRYPNGQGRLYAMDQVTLGQANTQPLDGDVIISEIMYHTIDNNDNLEFIELYNTTELTIDLSGWLITGGIEISFDQATTIEAQGTLLVLPFDPTTNLDLLLNFSTEYPNAVYGNFVGGFDGKLSNDGERISLQRPDQPPIDEPGFTPYITVDTVRYNDSLPWPLNADGNGKSLVRINAQVYGDDPANWQDVDPTPGAAQYTIVVDPIPGDANGDGAVGLLDLDILGQNYGVLTDATYAMGDFNGDGAVGLIDLDILGQNYGFSSESSTIPGDANEDGSVGLLDLDILGTNYGMQPAAQWHDADFNGDGAVGLLDLDILGSHFGESAMNSLDSLVDLYNPDNEEEIVMLF